MEKKIIFLSIAFLLFAIAPDTTFAQRPVAKLTTTGDQPATVNGTSAASGATILTGATIETPDLVGATIDLGVLGTLQLQPNAKIKLDFNDSGNVRVQLLGGCAMIKKNGPGEAEAYTAEGASEKTNSRRREIGGCYTSNGSIVAPAAAQDPVGSVVEDGIQRVTFEVPAGRIKVFLPDDAEAGGTISGTVTTEPNGRDAGEKSKNEGVLAGYVIDLGDGTTVKTDQPRFTWVPQGPPASKPRYRIRIADVFSSDMNPVRKPTPPSASGPIIPEPVNGPSAPRYSIRPIGQTGRNVVITGPFDGNSSNTNVTIGSTPITVIAESPRKAIVRSPTDVVGPTEIKVNEAGTQTTAPFRNLKIDLTAPKTNLLKGERTELRVQVSGLQGITSPVPVLMVTTGTVNTQGGNTQTINIQPSQVGPNGVFTQTFGLTGISAGAFSVVTSIVAVPRP
jgi:hypothetical protein